MEWAWGAVGYVAGVVMTLLTQAWLQGRSERRERYYATNICKDCPRHC